MGIDRIEDLRISLSGNSRKSISQFSQIIFLAMKLPTFPATKENTDRTSHHERGFHEQLPRFIGSSRFIDRFVRAARRGM
jgi:hypothetical protein